MTRQSDAGAAPASQSERIDKWLWFARVVKTRTLATALVQAGKVRLNGARVLKASQAVAAGDTLTVSVHRRIRVLEITGVAERRGPARAAVLLYRELTERPAVAICVEASGSQTGGAHAERPRGAGRPTKKDRRETDRLKSRPA